MKFDDIIGQEDAKARLRQELDSGRVAHALMLCGPEGCGALPLAIAFAQELLTRPELTPEKQPAQAGFGFFGDSPSDNELRQRAMADKLAHPDMHFVFPIYKRTSGKDAYCDDFLNEWREINLTNPYFGLAEWMEATGAENQQLIIYANESDVILKKLSLKSSQSGYKVMIIWLPEKMNDTCANKILKLLEEPPAQTVFILVSEQLDRVLPTIRSRTQIINLPSLSEEDIESDLVKNHAILPAEAKRIARSSAGSMIAALRTITDDEDSAVFFDLFVRLMRLSYARRVKEMKQWSDQVAGMGRERQKNFLQYCQKLIRENFIYNFQRHDELNYMNEKESEFAVKFAPFINENNVIGIMDELSLVQRDIIQNANARIVFFDFALKMIVLIKNR